MITRKALPRRAFLRGVGATVALPFLDAMAPALAASRIPGGTPRRMAFVYVPNGIDMRNWTPAYEGPLGELPSILEPMEPLKDDVLLLSNLTQNNGRALLDGAGDHGRCCGAYLTGVHVNKSEYDIKAGISCDQVVANQIGRETRFPSLEVGLEDSRQAGNCDSGYSCAYTNNLAWRSETQPLPPILNPRDLFERLFGRHADLSPEERRQQGRLQKSILDFVSEDTRRLQGKLGPTDNRKLDEYLSSVREIERQIALAENDDTQIEPGFEKPHGIPADFAEHFKLMTDIITVAFQADLSRVLTFLVTREGTSRPYRELGISDGHHPLTHHRNQTDMMDKVSTINTYHVKQFSKWMMRLKSIQEGDGNILDNSMIVYGAGLSDGNAHTHHDLPTIMVGGTADKNLHSGRRVVYRKETPMTNLYLSMMASMGVDREHFADSSGHLDIG
ncbi:MAG: DUF1552 domain-containing protein [Bryobacterales bacterium]|nr:DUF1552 domain-containing protein [Bryobacterales bacterium]